MEDRDREIRRDEEEIGRKGGSAEAYAGAHPLYEPTVTAVTDMVIPATRIQWGPVFAGLLVALSITFLWTALGVAVGVGVVGIGYWIVGFGAIGLFLGSLMAARTAKAPLLPAVLHAVIIWAMVMVLDVLAFGSIGGSLVGAMLRSALPPGGGMAATGITTGAAVQSFGLWFFIGFIILLVASVLGALAGMVVPEHHEELHS